MSKDIMSKIADLLDERQYTKEDMLEFAKQAVEECVTDNDVEFLYTALYEVEKEAENGK